MLTKFSSLTKSKYDVCIGNSGMDSIIKHFSLFKISSSFIFQLYLYAVRFFEFIILYIPYTPQTNISCFLVFAFKISRSRKRGLHPFSKVLVKYFAVSKFVREGLSLLSHTLRTRVTKSPFSCAYGSTSLEGVMST